MRASLKVPKIHCNGCVNTVTNAVRRLPGVQNVEASDITKEVTVEFDPVQVDEQRIRGALASVGYPAA